MPKRFDLLSFGSIYLDINCPDFPLAELLASEETIGKDYTINLGGSAVISVQVAGRLGLKTAFIGCVGQDFAGQQVKRLLEESAIHPQLMALPEAQTNLSLNFIDPQGQKIMAVLGSANQAIPPEAARAQLAALIPGVRYLYLGGYTKQHAVSQYYGQFIQLARQHQTQVVLDHGRIPASMRAEQIQQLRELAAQVDLYLPSQDEFLDLWGAQDLAAGIKQVCRLNPGITVVVKQGADGATGCDPTGQLIHLPALPVTPRNTVGAGDSFNGGLVSALCRGLPFAQAVAFANATAALKISQPDLPSWEEVRLAAEGRLEWRGDESE